MYLSFLASASLLPKGDTLSAVTPPLLRLLTAERFGRVSAIRMMEGHGTVQRIQFDESMSWKGALGFYDLHFSTSTHGWGVGEIGKIMHTNDSGETWIGQDSGDMTVGFNNLFSVYFVDAAIGWAVGAAGTIIHTADGGQTWTVQYAGAR